MTIAKAIHQRMKQTGHTEPSSILTIISDDHNVHCLTEQDLDTWWASLDPVEKADIYEEHLERQVVAEDADSSQGLSAVRPYIETALKELPSVDSILASAAAELTKNLTALINARVAGGSTVFSCPQVFPIATQPSSKGEHHAE